ncbi:hypothetical protein WA026_011020 [Henosepilachna vigintioctopunctata]|uniref:Transmembrane protein n=1 Tax=Henosepilachna vigintioctopunctata TaxID=420089 RepID=A0AAW1UZU9_9CUCU
MHKMQMLSILKNGRAKSVRQKRVVRFCITHRQSTILFTILMFIFSAIFTTCATLGYSHAEETLDILKNDIDIEQEKQIENGGRISSNNEVLLIHSQHAVITNKYILQTLMHFGWILLLTSAILIYGTATESPILMLPWIVLSAWIYMCLIVSEILLYFDYIDGLNFINNKKYVVPTLIVSVVFFLMWYVIVWYHISIKTRRCSQYSIPKAKTVYTQEGFIHTVNPSKVYEQKKSLL